MWSSAYQLGASIHRGLYISGLLKKTKFSVPVVGIGNISFGGSGKTMITAEIARQLSNHGRTVGVVTRSYKAACGPHILSNDNCNPEITGDEAAMLYSQIGDKIIIASGKNKTDTVAAILNKHPEIEVIIVDDAFQHHKLHKDLNILIWPKANECLRESMSAGLNADIFIVPNGHRSPVSDDKTIYFVRESTGISFQNGKRDSHELLESDRVLAVCGVGPGSANSFFDAAAKLTGTFQLERPGRFQKFQFPDHVTYNSHKNISRLVNASSEVDVIITTAKDAVKLNALNVDIPPVAVLESKIKFLTNEALLYQCINKAIG